MLAIKVQKKPLIYLDSAATTLTPQTVLDKMNEYYHVYKANVHRALHTAGERATEEYEQARHKIARFINASAEEIVFTRGTTESINLLASSLTKNLKPGDEIVLTKMEHHSNLVPWQQIAKEKQLVLKYISLIEDGCLDMEEAQQKITKKTKIVACSYVSNVLGTINDIAALARLAHQQGAVIVIDGAQAMMHLPVDVKKLDCDFLCFSGHKMAGPTGIGVLYGKKKALNNLPPFLYGGEMIREVSYDHATWNDVPWKFEAGTPPIAEAIGLGMAVEYLTSIGMQQISEQEKNITSDALKKLRKVPGITIYGPASAKKRSSIISFTLNNVHPHDVAAFLDAEGIAIRAGHLCAMPLVTQVLKVPAVCRVSCAFYNTEEEIDVFINALKKVRKVFSE